MSGKGFPYFFGKKWAEITREERFFCQYLHSLVEQNRDYMRIFIDYINEKTKLDLPNDNETEWECGYEVCFYRDLSYFAKKEYDKIPVSLFPIKRTFDLCLFSKERIVIIEAKCQQIFHSSQLKIFENDHENIKKLFTELTLPLYPPIQCYTLGLVSSKYLDFMKRKNLEIPFPEKDDFYLRQTQLLSWKDLAKKFGDDHILLRADNIFLITDLQSGGQNKQGYKTGTQLYEMYLSKKNQNSYVGRAGGRSGKTFEEDIKSGRWRDHYYEFSQGSKPLNRNWFTLEEFYKAVHQDVQNHGSPLK